MARQEDLLAVPHVANFVKVAEKTTYGLAQKSDLLASKVGGQWRFRRTALDSWIDAKAQAGGVQLADGGARRSQSSREV